MLKSIKELGLELVELGINTYLVKDPEGDNTKIIASLKFVPYVDLLVIGNEFTAEKELYVEVVEISGPVSGGFKPVGVIGGRGLERSTLYVPKIENGELKAVWK